MKRIGRQLLVLVSLASVLYAPLTSAQPADDSARYWFLDRLSASDLVPADWELLRQNILLALYELGDGESVGWSEPVSGHSGSVRVISTVTAGDGTCRRLRVSVDVDAGSDDGIFELCRTGSTGFWRLTTSTLALHHD
ncbi:MAG: hypothetical protein JNK40_10935 [Chromatiales bacterium]|nr:hypothetical protein [Chromatiales bacterium]